jgi:prolyl-tRNA synthetase
LGQNFAKASQIKFLSEQGKEEYAWTTSWGVSTRLIGGLIMTHSDDNGLIVPPRLAPLHVVILPVMHKDENKGKVMEYCEALLKAIRAKYYDGEPIRVELDTRDMQGGERHGHGEKGVPVTVEIGPKRLKATVSILVEGIRIEKRERA